MIRSHVDHDITVEKVLIVPPLTDRKSVVLRLPRLQVDGSVLRGNGEDSVNLIVLVRRRNRDVVGATSMLEVRVGTSHRD